MEKRCLHILVFCLIWGPGGKTIVFHCYDKKKTQKHFQLTATACWFCFRFNASPHLSSINLSHGALKSMPLTECTKRLRSPFHGAIRCLVAPFENNRRGGAASQGHCLSCLLMVLCGQVKRHEEMHANGNARIHGHWHCCLYALGVCVCVYLDRLH